MIRLRGKWFQVAGFEKGKLVQVEVTARKMILAIAESPNVRAEAN